MEIIKVDPEKVEDNPYQPRSHYPRKTIDEIAYSIEQIGIIHIPTGRQVDGHYELAEGHLRKRAYIKLKKKNPKKFGEMPLDIREIADRDMAIIALEENLRRQDITPLDQARAVDLYLVNFTGVTEVALAKTLNMTQGNIANMRRVLKCPDEVLQKIVGGKINFTMARELLVFRGLNVGFDEEYRGGKSVKVPKDEKWLMLKAVRGVGGQYGLAATVDGIKWCIYDVANSNLKHLEKETSYYGGGDRNPLFDTKAAGCLKCPKMIRAFETKSKASHFCTDSECWDKKQETHKKQQETKARKKMEADITKRIAETKADFPQEKSATAAYKMEKRGSSWIAIDGQGRIIAVRQEKKVAEESAKASFELVATVVDPKPEEFVLNHTYRIVAKPGIDCPHLDVTAQNLTISVEALGLKSADVELAKVHKSSGKIGTGGYVSAGWSKCTESLDDLVPAVEEQTISQEIPAFATWDEVCKGCIQQKGCERTGRNIVSADEGGGYACKDRVTKENYQEVREKAKVDMPDSFKNLVKDRAGTRAIVLDLRELRLGSYRDELKAGHAMLDGTFYEQGEGLYGGRQRQLLQAIEDPEECTERCTEGFHYAYDSDKMDGEVHFVCSKPKCLTKKKAAFTRAKNAAGTGKKKAEMKAIKQAVEETGTIDKPRLLLIMEAQLQGSHIARGYGGDHFDWLAKRLKIEKEGMGESKQTLILKKLPGLSEEELRKLVVEFCLITLCYEGNIKGYRIQTTEELNRMGIGIQVEKA